MTSGAAVIPNVALVVQQRPKTSTWSTRPVPTASQDRWRTSTSAPVHKGVHKSMGQCKKDVTPVRQQWSYVSCALIHRNVLNDWHFTKAFFLNIVFLFVCLKLHWISPSGGQLTQRQHWVRRDNKPLIESSLTTSMKSCDALWIYTDLYDRPKLNKHSLIFVMVWRHLCPTRFWVVVICPIIKCLTVLEFSFILFDLCLFITIFNFI